MLGGERHAVVLNQPLCGGRFNQRQRSRQKYDAYDDQKYDSQKSVKNTIPKIPQKYENNLPIKFIYTN